MAIAAAEREWQESGMGDANTAWMDYYQANKREEPMNTRQAYFARKAFIAGYCKVYVSKTYSMKRLAMRKDSEIKTLENGYFVLGLISAAIISVLIVSWVTGSGVFGDGSCGSSLWNTLSQHVSAVAN